MANEKQRKTFLSYSRINKDFAVQLAKELKADGFSVWLDQLDIPTGSRWDDELEKALEECEIFMVIMTPASIASENVKDEIGYAIDNNKRILPVLLENAKVPLRLRRFQYVDFTSKSYDEGVASAKRLLSNLINEDTIPRGQAPVVSKPKVEAQKLSQPITAGITGDKVESDRFKATRENVIKASDLLAQGRKLFENKDWVKAAEIFRQVLTFTPNHAETKKLLADAEAQISQKPSVLENKNKENAEHPTGQKVDAEQIAKKQAEAKAETDRLAARKAEEEKQARADADRKAKDEADRLAAQKAEADRIAKQQEEAVRLAQAKAETDRKAREEAERRLAAQREETVRLAQAKAESERKAREEAEQRLAAQNTAVKPAGKKSIVKRIVIGGVVGVVLCIVAVFVIGSWGNNNVTPTDTPQKATATKPKPTATKPKATATQPVDSPSDDIGGVWEGYLYEEGKDPWNMTLDITQDFQGFLLINYGDETYEIFLDSWNGTEFYFTESDGRHFWGTLENGYLVGYAAWDCYVDCGYWGTFELSTDGSVVAPVVGNPSDDIGGVWEGYLYEEGKDPWNMTLDITQDFQGFLLINYGDETYEIFLDSWNGTEFYFTESDGRHFWGTLENGYLVGYAAWDCYVDCGYWGTFELSK